MFSVDRRERRRAGCGAARVGRQLVGATWTQLVKAWGAGQLVCDFSLTSLHAIAQLGAEGSPAEPEGCGLVDESRHRKPVCGSLGLGGDIDPGGRSGDEPDDPRAHAATPVENPRYRGGDMNTAS